jgi:hypothetical protein
MDIVYLVDKSRIKLSSSKTKVSGVGCRVSALRILTPDTRHLKPFKEANRLVDIACRLRYKRTFATEDLLLAARMVFMKGIENE